MIRLRARTQGLRPFIWDGEAADPTSSEAARRARITRAARKADAAGSYPAGRVCGRDGCGSVLSRYNPGPVCMRHVTGALS